MTLSTVKIVNNLLVVLCGLICAVDGMKECADLKTNVITPPNGM